MQKDLNIDVRVVEKYGNYWTKILLIICGVESVFV